jgi:hypothetical protein
MVPTHGADVCVLQVEPGGEGGMCGWPLTSICQIVPSHVAWAACPTCLRTTSEKDVTQVKPDILRSVTRQYMTKGGV